MTHLKRVLEAIGVPEIVGTSEKKPAAARRSGEAVPPGQSRMTPAAAVVLDPLSLHDQRVRSRKAAELADKAVRTSTPPLDDSQRAAIASACSRRLSVICGPPGTGKTETLAAMVQQLADREAHRDSGGSCNILLTGPNCRVVAELAERVVRRMPKDESVAARLFIVHREGGEDEFQVPEGSADGRTVRKTTADAGRPEFRDLIDSLNAADKPNVNIVAAVVHECPKIGEQAASLDCKDPVLRPLFDFLLIDESSQVDTPIAIPSLALLKDEFQVVLAGDALHTPPVSRRNPPVGAEHLAGSIQKRMVERFSVPEESLLANYRSAGELVEFTRSLGYPEELQAVFPTARVWPLSDAAEFETDLEAAGLALSEGWGAVLDPKKRIVAITHRDGVDGQANRFEADCVASLVYLLRKTASANLAYHRDEGEALPYGAENAERFWHTGVAVVTPHRAHRAAIVRRLCQAFPRDEEAWIEGAVDTVERFQGGERHTIIVAFGVSDPDLIAGDEKFHMQIERANVAVSRAMAKCIVLMSEELAGHVPTDRDATMNARTLKCVAAEWCKEKVEVDVRSQAHGSRRIAIRWRRVRPSTPYSDRLVTKLETFDTIVVPTSGIRSDLIEAYTHWKKGQDVEGWAEPTIRTWQDQIRSLWETSSHEFAGRRLLSPIEFRYQWMNAGVQALEKLLKDDKKLLKDEATPDTGWRFRYVSDICDAALGTWKFVNTYDIDLGGQPEDETLKGYFRAWVDKYRKNAKEPGWISDAELLRTLRDSISRERAHAGEPTSGREPRTLYVTLPGEQHDRIQFIWDAIALNPNNEQLELACESSTDEGINHEIRFVAFDTTSEEIEAAAAWALRHLQSHAVSDGESRAAQQECAGSVRIGIVIPETRQTRLAVERQFLATFCPDGYRAWETPEFRIVDSRALIDTAECQQVLSYIRTVYAQRIDYKKAREFLRSARHSDLVPGSVRDKVEEKLYGDYTTRTSFKFGKDSVRVSLPEWAKRFRNIIEGALDNLKSGLRSQFGDRLCAPIEKLCDSGERPSLDDLIEALRATNGADPGETDLVEILERIRATGSPGTEGAALSLNEERLLARLEELIEKIDESRTVRRLLCVVENLREVALGADTGLDFNEAYAHLRNACREEVLPGGGSGCPVEIHTLERATGRHFTHLWVIGMRDSDWPPQVPVDPLLDLDLDTYLDRGRAGDEHVARLFDHDDRYRRALARLRLTIDQCRNRDAIVISYAGRDASSDRLFMPSRGLGALRTGEVGAGWRGTHHESLLWTGGASFRRYESLDDYAFHPACSRVEEPKGDGFPWVPEEYNADVPMPEGEGRSAEAVRQPGYDEVTRQFECPFRAFAIHRISVEPQKAISGNAGNDADAKRIRDFISDLETSGRAKDADGSWPGCLEPAWPEGSTDHPHYGIVSFESKSGNTGKYILDCRVGTHGAFEEEELSPPDEKVQSPQISKRTVDAFRELLKREKYFPLRILQYTLDALDKTGSCSSDVSSDTYVGYIIGKKNSGKLEVVKHFEIPIGELADLRPEDGKKGATLQQLIDRLRREFQGGSMKPDPIGGNARIPNNEGKGVCGSCHLRTACRYHFTGDPLRCGSRDEE